MRTNLSDSWARHLSRYLAPWPSPTARSKEWKASYALKVYITVWIIVLGWKVGLQGLGVNVHIGVITLVVDAVMLIAMFSLRGSRSSMARDLGICRVPSARSVGYALVALGGLVSFVRLSSIIFPSTDVSPLNGVSQQSTLDIVLAGFAACCSAPLIEELFFRGFIYRSLRNRLPVLTAVPVAGIMFGAIHVSSYPLASLPYQTFFGVVACLLYERVGSLLPGIVLHIFIDSGAFSLAVGGTIGLVSIIAVITATGLLLSPVVRACRRFVSHEPVLREYRSVSELVVT